jgi:hypothetical protein
MDYHCAEVGFQLPALPWSFSYIAVFIGLYIAACFLFKRVKYKLPYFRRIKQILDTYNDQRQKMKSLADLPPSSNK